jgi:hypothetical protein
VFPEVHEVQVALPVADEQDAPQPSAAKNINQFAKQTIY